MKAHRISIALAPELAGRVRAAARRSGSTLSEWIAEVVTARLRSDVVDAERRSKALNEYLADYQQRHGAFTEKEILEARGELGFETGS